MDTLMNRLQIFLARTIPKARSILVFQVRLALTLVLVLILVFACSSLAAAQSMQDDEMKVAAKVVQLQLQLEDANLAKRESAEKELVELGVGVLDYLEPATDETPTEAVERLGRIRKALEALAVESHTQPRRISIKGSYSVKEAIEQLVAKSENKIVWPAAIEEAIQAKQVELDIDNQPFWKAIDQLTGKASMRVDSFNSQPGQIMLVPAEPNSAKLPVDSNGIFQASVLQVSASRNLENPALNYCGVRIRIRWEPRLAPIMLSMPASGITVIDEFDEKIELPNPDAVFSAGVQPEIPEVELVIPIGLVDRQVENISQLQATLKATLPGRSETFEFKKIGRLKAGFRQSKAGVSVSYEGFQKNEDLYGVKVKYSFDEAGGALESHLGWVYENPLQLIDADGKEYSPLTIESAGRTENSVAIRYYFSVDPAPMNLRCETAAAIVSTEVKIRLKNNPLP